VSKDELKQTPLTAVHRDLGARMVPFAGYEMPVLYSSTVDEHLAVRHSVGLFDVSHMGEFFVTGPDALSLIQGLTCNNVERLKDGQVHYSALTYPEGTIVDDLLVYRFNDQKFMLCVNAANREKDLKWIQDHQTGDVEVRDLSDRYTQIAIQGRNGIKILQPLVDVDLSEIKFYWFQEGKVDGVDAVISRTGYTGEDGFEIYFSPDPAPRIWNKLLEAGKPYQITSCGLAARNTLRLESKMALYGNDIDDTTNVLEAGLGWICKLKKGEFIGRDALRQIKAEGLKRKLVGFEMLGRGIARDHYPVLIDGRVVSEVTSGSYSPYLKKNIGLCYLPIDHTEISTGIQIEIRNKPVDARVVETPFYKRDY